MSREEQKILALLTENIGNYVDSRELSLIALQYPRVIKQLREQYGYVIINHVDRVGRKSVRGRYMLCTDRQAAAFAIGQGKSTQKMLDAAARDESETTLFDLTPFDKHRDLN